MIETLELRDLSCGGCAVTIRTALDIAGFTSVKVNILSTPHTVSAEVEDENRLEVMKSVLRDHGYPMLDDIVDETEPQEYMFS
jgi:copper chaperone CopZ